MPHLATPTLTAFLRSSGVDVTQRDLNLEVIDHILSRDYMTEALSRIRQPSRSRGRSRTPPPSPDLVKWAQNIGPRLVAGVKAAKALVKSPAFYDGPRGFRAFETLSQCLMVASLPFYPALLELSRFISFTTPQQASRSLWSLPEDDSAALIELVRSPTRNIFYHILERLAIDEIAEVAPDVVGISIATAAQFVAGLTVADLIKKRGLDCHIVVGGPHITMLREQLPKAPALFDLVDSAIVFSGERPLLELVETLAAHRDLSKVPNLVYRDGAKVRTTLCVEPIPLAELPMPDFDGLPLDSYLAPDLVLPLVTSRGCYHAKCAFCNVGYGGPTRFEQHSAEVIVEQMRAVHDRYGTQHIFFADEAISLGNLNKVSQALIKIGAPFHWSGCVRFEKGLTKDLLTTMRRGGCRMIMYGLESASEEILRRMVKGTQSTAISRILRQSRGAGIWNHIFVFFGFPGESIEDVQATVNFLYAHKGDIHSAAFGTFMLQQYSPAYELPDQYGLVRTVPGAKRDLAVYLNYQVENGIDQRTAENLVARFTAAHPVTGFAHFYIDDTWRFLHASRLTSAGARFPGWLNGSR